MYNYNLINKKINNDICYIFGYGSLVNTKSRNRTSITIAQPGIINKEFSYIRYYNTSQPKLPTLGIVKIQESIKKLPINGVLFKVNDDQLKQFDKREFDYTRIRVSPNFIYTFDKHIDTSLPIYIYVPKFKPYCSNCTKPINYKYVRTIHNGFKEYGKEFYNFFVKTTLGLPHIK